MLNAKEIYLDSIKEENLPLLFKWINDRETVLLSSYYKPVSENEHRSWFENIKLDKSVFIFGIFLLKGNKLIGTCKLLNLNFIDRNGELQIRIGDRHNQSKGYGQQAIKLLVDFAFKDLNLTRIYLFVFDDNTRAIKAYQKIGFIEEGILRKHAHIDGKYRNVIIMGLLREESEK